MYPSIRFPGGSDGTIGKIQKQYKCPEVDEWIKKHKYIRFFE